MFIRQPRVRRQPLDLPVVNRPHTFLLSSRSDPSLGRTRTRPHCRSIMIVDWRQSWSIDPSVPSPSSPSLSAENFSSFFFDRRREIMKIIRVCNAYPFNGDESTIAMTSASACRVSFMTVRCRINLFNAPRP